MQKILSLNLLARATSLAAITMLGACTIETNNSSSSSENKHETLVHVSSAGVESCPLGGYMIEQGDDINGNGVLDPDEVLGVPDEICSGEVNIVPEPRGNTCAAGGFKISFVLDASNEDTYICHGNPPVVDALDIGSSACPHGGYALTFGEEDPISICHGGNGVNGQNGQSAYELWLTEGNTGSAQDFLNSLKGDAGATGAQGAAGFSAYELWISLGNTGNEEDFLNSLKGGQGADGANGNDGANGQDGQSAYELWQANGNTGTVQDFLNSLKGETGAAGEQGATGATGLSAYDLWTSLGNTGTEEDFLNSLKGEQGAEGVDGATGQNGEDGLQSLAAISEIPAGDSMCLANNGGALINFALDIDGDGVLNEDEIAQGQSSVVCNGADGANGLDALQPLVAITEIPVGDTMCLAGNGGLIVTFALDVDGNGELSNDEISAGQSSQVCNGSNGASAYEIWLAEGNTGSIQDFLDSLKGETGATGEQGEAGQNGEQGESAYVVWLSLGNTGSESEFINSLKGEQGETGAQGVQGEQGGAGADGQDAIQPLMSMVAIPVGDTMCPASNGGLLVNFGLDQNNNGLLDPDEIETEQSKVICNGSHGQDGSNGTDGLNGQDGAQSLVSVAAIEQGGAECTVSGGYLITSWLDSNSNGQLDSEELRSSTRVAICHGETGAAGQDGQSALQLWLALPENTNKSDTQFWDEIRGDNGVSAFELWQSQPGNETKTETEFWDSLVGPAGEKGEDGLSALELWFAENTWADGDESYFWADLKGENGYNSLVNITNELAGLNCPFGGHRIDTGLDIDRDELLGADEILNTSFICFETLKQLLLNDTGSTSNIIFDTTEEEVRVRLNDCGIISWNDPDYDFQYNTNYLDCKDGWDSLGDYLFKIEDGADAGFDFTRLNPDNGKIAISYSPSTCVQDNYTGLVWWVIDNQDGYRDYAEINAQLTNGDFNRCGSTNWRIPTLKELQTIIHYGSTSDYFLDEKFFDISTIAQAGEPSVWIRNNLNAYDTYALSIKDGTIKPVSNTNANHTILVRGVK